MPKLGLGLSLATPAAPSGIPTADPDAVAYIGKVGITDVVAQNAINDFVLGMKALGLYNDMVCWPLRLSQNAGTGTTADRKSVV